MRFRGFNSVSTDPGSICLRPLVTDDDPFGPCIVDGSDRSDSTRPFLAACAGLTPSLFQFADGVRPALEPLNAMFQSYLSCPETSISFWRSGRL